MLVALNADQRVRRSGSNCNDSTVRQEPRGRLRGKNSGDGRRHEHRRPIEMEPVHLNRCPRSCCYGCQLGILRNGQHAALGIELHFHNIPLPDLAAHVGREDHRRVSALAISDDVILSAVRPHGRRRALQFAR